MEIPCRIKYKKAQEHIQQTNRGKSVKDIFAYLAAAEHLPKISNANYLKGQML